jgi:hypothetical protein
MFDPAYNKLITHWQSENLGIAPGSSEQDVRDFEFANGVILPNDFRQYFLHVNGMLQRGGHDVDRNGFSFWPLSRVKSVRRECPASSSFVSSIAEPDRYFVFADYLQWSWAYAVRLDSQGLQDGEIAHVGTRQPKVVAASFGDFVEMYLSDAEDLYPTRQPHKAL